MENDILIKRISKGKNQNRVTIPRGWKADYVALKPMEFKIDGFAKRRKNVR